jgi:hypothetical protein
MAGSGSWMQKAAHPVKETTVLCLGVALCFLVACIPIATAPKRHQVRVVDAESGAPVANAVIDLHYFPSSPEAPEPNHPHATADGSGAVTIGSAARPAIWQVRAIDYIEQRSVAKEGALPPRYAAHAGGGYDGVAHLYQLPEPRLAVLVSDTYTGPLTINLQPAPGFGFTPTDEINVAFAAVDPQASYVQGVAGSRAFTETASGEGVVNLVVTPLLYDITASQLQIRDSAGVLPYRDIANPGDRDRGVWGTVNDDDKRLHHQIRLFVGTLADYREVLKSRP